MIMTLDLEVHGHILFLIMLVHMSEPMLADFGKLGTRRTQCTLKIKMSP